MSEADGGPSTSNNGSNSKEITQLQNELDAAIKKTDDLTKTVMDLQSTVDSTNKNVTSVTKDVNALKNPTPPTPLDGIMLAQMGILDLVMKACNYEANCCDADELTLKYGPTITSAQDCIDAFNDLVAKGVNPNFLSGSVPVVSYIVSVAQALASSEIKVQINSDAIKTCEDWLDMNKCDSYSAPSTDTSAHCSAFGDITVNPCAVDQLLTGMQDKGEVCGVIFGIGGCKTGLVCRSSGGPNGGICTEPVGAGSRCLEDSDCQSDLYCNGAMGQCQMLASEGDDCDFLDPSFTSSAVQIAPPTSASSMQGGLAIQCKSGLQCDPSSKKCIQSCSEDSLCQPGSGSPYYSCPDGMVCNVTAVPSLYSNPTLPGTASYGYGVCRKPGAAGDACTFTTGSPYAGSECDSKNCQQTSGGDKVCGDALKQAGDDCVAVGTTDSTCATQYCGTDGKCVKPCDVSGGHYSCDSGFYCNSQQTIISGGTFTYACEPLIASTSTCGFSAAGGRDTTCSSGFCNAGTGNCTDKVAEGAACPSGSNLQCPSTQYCDTTMSTATCVNFVAAAADCSGKSTGACGPTSHCYTNASQTPNSQCVATAGAGEDCNSADSQTCDQTTASLVCVTGINKCYASGKYPVDAPCTNDTQCDSGWCGDSGSNKKCMAPIADGADCDSDTAKNLGRCVTGDYCQHDSDNSAGKCAAQHSAGQACEPRYAGTDCLNHSNPTDASLCAQSGTSINGNGGTFVCGARAVASMTVLCDGK